jgi:hypothetical protein
MRTGGKGTRGRGAMGLYSYSVIEINDEGQLIRLPGYNGAGGVG